MVLAQLITGPGFKQNSCAELFKLPQLHRYWYKNSIDHFSAQALAMENVNASQLSRCGSSKEFQHSFFHLEQFAEYRKTSHLLRLNCCHKIKGSDCF